MLNYVNDFFLLFRKKGDAVLRRLFIVKVFCQRLTCGILFTCI